ncbi:MAG TPA: type II toxin-antitoxin system prevent-host-death family antitoxin [Rhizomicrobium sp.]|nr:type II toxin-antitoxin system prevent-host-death family antitoxin [Rhizomicrobium sp.]
MNKIVTASEANRSFSKLLSEVDKGHEITVTNHGRVVARIVPPSTPSVAEREKARERLLEHLRSQKPLNSGPWSRAEAYDEDL